MALITSKTLLTEADDADVLHIVDVSDTTDNAAGTSKKISREGLMTKGIADQPFLFAPSDAITTPGTASHQIAVDIGGTTYYLVAYTHGS